MITRLFGRPLIEGNKLSQILELNKDNNNIQVKIMNIAKEINDPFSKINKTGKFQFFSAMWRERKRKEELKTENKLCLSF